jgi:hypothetical protein
MFHCSIGIRTFAVAAFVFACSQKAMAADEDVGAPAFKPVASQTMALKYGANGASVFDHSLKKWIFQKLATTIMSPKAEGYVNQINDNFALAAGQQEVAVYDYSKHKWILSERSTPDSKTERLKNNFVLTKDYAEVALLNGPKIRYTSNGGWAEKKGLW